MFKSYPLQYSWFIFVFFAWREKAWEDARLRCGYFLSGHRLAQPATQAPYTRVEKPGQTSMQACRTSPGQPLLFPELPPAELPPDWVRPPAGACCAAALFLLLLAAAAAGLLLAFGWLAGAAAAGAPPAF
jgi:hypothetical protein